VHDARDHPPVINTMRSAPPAEATARSPTNSHRPASKDVCSSSAFRGRP
jgi:hypothetical protein